MAQWVGHTKEELLVQWILLKSHDKFVKDKEAELKVDVKALIDDFSSTIQSFEENIADLKKVVLQGSILSVEALSKFHVLEPKSFTGHQNAKELKNFLWDMEQYSKVA